MLEKGKVSTTIVGILFFTESKNISFLFHDDGILDSGIRMNMKAILRQDFNRIPVDLHTRQEKNSYWQEFPIAFAL